MNKVKIGLLGCGTISQYAHLLALEKADNVELTATCEIAEDLLRQISQRFATGRCFSDYEQFLAEADIEAVVIATADQQHVQQAKRALLRGKHVLVEKPLGLDLDECLSLAGVVETTGRKLQVGNMKRFDPGIEFAERFIRERMRHRLSVSGWYCDSTFRPVMQNALRLPPIRSTSQVGLDPSFKSHKKSYKLLTHGCHLVNTLRFFGGEIAAVQAKFATKYGNLTWHGVLDFADGAAGHFELTTAVNMDWTEGFLIHGEGGSVEVRSFLPFYNRQSEVRAFDAGRGEYRSPLEPDSDAYERQIEAFARAILRDEPVSPNVYDGVADIAVIRAIEESVETGRWAEVKLPSQVGTLSQ